MVIVTAAIVGFALTVMTWGADLWGRTAPAAPGGGYAFAAFVGTLLPAGLAVAVMSLGRVTWKASPLRSVGWAVASLSGAAAVFVWAVVVFAGFRPKHRRDWDGGCYARGNPCWIHVEYPWFWAVGLLSTVLVSTVLITTAMKIMRAREVAKAGPGESPADATAG
ncbi:hypothetical protein ACWD4F_00235 [Streptomyces aureus]|uniref:hypothetical protein n=1 Tax=Streptomyces aureus TaxID=193461 RepID=UPI00056A916E|nr:hypothetical protein [Streptomyces aureus]